MSPTGRMGDLNGLAVALALLCTGQPTLNQLITGNLHRRQFGELATTANDGSRQHRHRAHCAGA
jgi:hypothetical protein